MNIPTQILQNLKCSNCENLLSCGPVLIAEDGTNVCGRCSVLEDSSTPNKAYNELAAMCMFPCKYETDGCVDKYSFATMQQHEADCAFRTYVCPVMPAGKCDWVGPQYKILEHTTNEHPESVLGHPAQFTHDLSKDSFTAYLMRAFDILFLVHVKISLTTHSIYHSILRIGNANDGITFKYKVYIENDNGAVTKNGDVVSERNLTMHEESSVVVKMNTLIEALIRLDDIKFHISLKESVQCYNCKIMTDAIEIYDKMNKIFYCTTCLSSFKSCANFAKGCLWKAPKAHGNHTNYFCTYLRWCSICQTNIEEYNMIDHTQKKNHNTSIKHSQGKYCTVRVNKYQQNFTIKFHDITYLFIRQEKSESLEKFFLQGRPHQCNRIKCNLILRNPKNKNTAYYIMEEEYSVDLGQNTWFLHLPENKVLPFIFDSNFEVGVDIYYNE